MVRRGCSLPAALTAVALLASGWSSPAGASQVPLTRVTALAPITLGFSGGADPVLASGNPVTQAQWAPLARTEDAQMLRLDVSWGGVAPAVPADGFNGANPSDPGYNWTQVDQEARELASFGAKIMVTISGAPTWAQGQNRPTDAFGGTWEPSATDLGEFATAIATRFDGRYPDPLNAGQYLPRISIWQGWNEPNVPEELAPQYVSSASGPQQVGAAVYRNMENAFYRGVKGVSRSNYVVLAGLAPYGDSPGTTVTDRTRPVAFLRSLLCVSANGRRRVSGCAGPTYFDAIDSHPYGIYGPNWHAFWADDVSVPDVHKLAAVLSSAERLGTALPAGKKGDWVTETSYDSNPPNPGGVPLAQQALWLEQSVYNFWKQGVSTVLWWQLADQPLPATVYSYQAGTYFVSGQAKPSATSFRFPFLSRRLNRARVMIWSRAPTAGIVAIQKQAGAGWATVARARVRPDEVFELTLNLRHAATLRAQLGSDTSLPWTQAG